MMRLSRAAGCATVTIVTATMAAQADFALPEPPPPIEMHRAAGPILIDGDLDDPGWRGAARIERFYEASPGDNVEPKVRTVTLLTYDDRYLYIGLICDD